jgi:hypothetical protein
MSTERDGRREIPGMGGRTDEALSGAEERDCKKESTDID